MKYIHRFFSLATLVLAASLALSACAPKEAGPASTPTAEPSPSGAVPATPTPTQPDSAFVTPLSEALNGISYYGDPADCALTLEQASAYAQLLKTEIDKVYTNFETLRGEYDYYRQGNFTPRAFAALVDFGSGVPALLFGSGLEEQTEYGSYLQTSGGEDATAWAIWQLQGNQPVMLENLGRTMVYADHLYVGGYYVADPGLSAQVYPAENGRITSTPSTSAQQDWYWEGDKEYSVGTIDGQSATEAQIDAWEAQWAPEGSLAGYSHGSDVSVNFWGMCPAEDVYAALTLAISGEVPAADSQPQEGLTESYDPATQIRRTTMDTAGAPLEIYFEVPVFQQESAGYSAINAFFQAKQDEFFAGDFEEIRTMALEGNPYNETFYDLWSVSITGQTSKLVTVGLFNDYHMGGPHPWSTAEYYTFRTDTGELVTLSEILNASPDEIEAFLLSELALQNDAAGGEIDMNTFRAYGADDYSFALRDGKVYVEFDRYEGVSYAFGYIDSIEMTMGLKPEWQ